MGDAPPCVAGHQGGVVGSGVGVGAGSLEDVVDFVVVEPVVGAVLDVLDCGGGEQSGVQGEAGEQTGDPPSLGQDRDLPAHPTASPGL